MNSVRESMSGPAGTFVKVIMIIVGFYVLYVVYKFLYSEPSKSSDNVIPGVTLGRPAATKDSKVSFLPGKSTSTTKAIFKIVTGDSFSIEYWMYVKDTTYRPHNNNFILSLGEPITGDGATAPTAMTAANQALLVYLTGRNYGLAVRTNAVKDATPALPRPLLGPAVTTTFNTTAQVASAGSDLATCDIASIDLQKWVHVGIVYEGKTLDVYLDGKLARSCILPGNIHIMTTYQLNVFAFGGFGGYVSNVTTHDYPLNPEQMWRIYMAGPGPSYTFWEYVKSMFDPKAIGTLTYPKYPS